MNQSDYISAEPFSVYALPRPFKIAFLLNPDESKYKILDSIIEYNCKIWGGRFNPIIPVIDGSIPDSYWQLLQFIDPDIIYLFDGILEETKLKIVKEIQPLQIITHRSSDSPHIDLSINHISVNYIIKKLSNSILWDSFRDNIIPISNDFNQKERKLHKFIFRNFCIEDDVLNGRHYSKISKTAAINENDSLENFFSFFDSSKNYIFPIQLCAVNSSPFYIQDSYLYEKFSIIIEESIWSYILLWNKPLFYSSHGINKINQLCLPLNIFDDKTLAKSMVKFFWNGLKQLSGGQNQIDIISLKSLSQDQRKNISEFCKYLNSYPNFVHQDPLKIPKIKGYAKDIENIPETIHQKVDKLKINLNLPVPLFFEKKPFDDSIIHQDFQWMADYKIEYRPEKFKYTNVNYWWILNKRSNITRLFFNYSFSKINNAGLISLQINSSKKDIELSIPPAYNLFFRMIVNEINYEHNSEKKVLQSYYKYAQISDKGRYLLATINLFDNVYAANFIYESNFWRTFFENKCKVNTQNDIEALERVKNKIRKNIVAFVQNYSSTSKDKNLDWLSHYIITKSKELKQQEIYFKYKELEDPAMSLIKESPGINSSDEQIYLDDFKSTFDSLLNQNIFLQGVKPSCNVCGSSFWYELQELSQSLKCKGCNSIFHIPFDIDWTFKINELIVNSISYHGVFPVIWCINELYHYSKNLIFHPALDLFINQKEKEEVDLVLIMDNKFAVCEVKTNIKEFSKKELDKIKRIAINTEADKIVLAGFYGERKDLEKIGEELKSDLVQNEIEVLTISPHDTVFEENAYF